MRRKRHSSRVGTWPSPGKPYTMKTLPLLPVEEKWECKRSGDCCTKPQEIVMTTEEASILVFRSPDTVQLEFRDVGDGFVAMRAGPCPLFIFKSCIVYEYRPYNCRRFICMRPDPTTEPFDVGGKNLMSRVEQSRVARRRAVLEQRRAQRWAQKHGWTPQKETAHATEDRTPGPSGPDGAALIRATRLPALR